MLWRNLVFVAIAPIVVALIVAALIVGMGSFLLLFHYPLGNIAHTGIAGIDEIKVTVPVALAFATIFLIGGAIASRAMGPGPADHH